MMENENRAARQARWVARCVTDPHAPAKMGMIMIPLWIVFMLAAAIPMIAFGIFNPKKADELGARFALVTRLALRMFDGL